MCLQVRMHLARLSDSGQLSLDELVCLGVCGADSVGLPGPPELLIMTIMMVQEAVQARRCLSEAGAAVS